MSKVLVCGGAGYIGSHTVLELKKQNYDIVVLDSLIEGHIEAIEYLGVQFEKGDINDEQFVESVIVKHKPDAVMHFCALLVVPDSCENPLSYYENNVVGTIKLLKVMLKHNVKKFIFSSTAAIFGQPEHIPIKEDDAKNPTNPYGETKLVVENMLKWYDQAYGIKYVCLRYFNACGADESGNIGEVRTKESHLVPIILQVALGQRPHLNIFGDDYDTKDGTCIRDYIHVSDLATAHIKALEFLNTHNQSQCFNLGSGMGYSVREIVEATRGVTGHSIPCVVSPRRAGDPPSLIASSSKAEAMLGWKRKYEDVVHIIETAWKFHSAHPNGYTTTN